MAETDAPDRPVHAGSSAKKAIWFVGAGAFLLVALTVALVALFDSPPKPRPLPDPNGYSDIVAAAQIIGSIPAQSVASPDITRHDLAVFVDSNRESLELARAGLSEQCGVWLTFGQNLKPFLDRIEAIRNLGRLLYAEGRLAELEGQPAAAAESYLDVIRLSHACRKGGLLLDCLTGIAIESMGIEGFGRVRDELTAAECRALITRLDDCEAGREPYDTYLTNEAIWRHKSIPAYQRFVVGISGAGRELLQVSIDQGEFAYKQSQARSRLLILSLAIQAYQKEHGEYPDSLADLGPDLPPGHLEDPFSERPFVYRSTEGGLVIYSVGPDGSDDGGRRLDKTRDPKSVTGDIVLEVDDADEARDNSIRP